MQRQFLISLAFAYLSIAQSVVVAEDYFPGKFSWEQVSPEEAGFDAKKLQQAVDLAIAKTVVEPNDIHQLLLDQMQPSNGSNGAYCNG